MRTESEVLTELAMYEAARTRILESGQRVTMANGTTVDQANISWIIKQIEKLRHELHMVQQGGQFTAHTGVFGGRR